MQKRKIDELISHFNRKVADMDIDMEYKMELLGMITAIGIACEKELSIEPERKTGKWIPHIEKSREYIGTVLVNVTYDYWLCDACGYRVENGQTTYNFCPHCGADMRGGRDG